MGQVRGGWRKDVRGVYDLPWWIFEVSYSILWVGGFVVLSFSCQKKERAYVGRLPPINPNQALDRHNPFWDPRGGFRRLRDVFWCHQDDPELEQLRREVWRSNGLIFLWLLGVPFLTFGTIALLSLAGHPLAL
jgi:hypothetical protein